MNLTVSQVTVTDGLLTSMKINCDIYCHRAPPLLITNPTVSVNNLRWEVPVSSHQRSVLRRSLWRMKRTRVGCGVVLLLRLTDGRRKNPHCSGCGQTVCV